MEVETNYKFSLQEKKVLTKDILNLFKLWNISAKEKKILLGLSIYNKQISKCIFHYYKDGKLDIVRHIYSKTLFRMLDLLRIHKNLRFMFPYNRDIVYEWIHTKRKCFNNNSALELMLNDNLGIENIRKYLDFYFSH